jgi:hypothetical protein
MGASQSYHWQVNAHHHIICATSAEFDGRFLLFPTSGAITPDALRA